MTKYYFKEYSGNSDKEVYALLKLDTERPYEENGDDFIAVGIFVSYSKLATAFDFSYDFISRDEMDDLKEISEEIYERWEKIAENINATARRLVSNRMRV